MKSIVYLLVLFMFSSCGKELDISQDFFYGKWNYDYKFYGCGNVGDPNNYLEECEVKQTFNLDYEFNSEGQLYTVSTSNSIYKDTLKWAFNEVSKTLLLYKDGPLGIEGKRTLRLDDYNSNNFIYVNKGSDPSNVFEYTFTRYE